MKNKYIILWSICLSLLTGCNFRKSVSTDMITGLSTKGDGLSADEVYISNGTDRLTENTFLYGQEIYTFFTNLEGFVAENGTIYPEMEVLVLSKAGDTVLNHRNLLGAKGFASKAADLNGNVILAAPIYSGAEYTVKYKVIDTKGSGVFYSEFDLELKPDPLIKRMENGLTIKEAYIYDKKTGTVVTDGKIGFGENVLLDVKGLSGYSLVDGKPNLEMSVLVTDATGKVFLDLPHLLKDMVISTKDIENGLGSTLIMNKGVLENPVSWKLRIWDKNNGAEVNVLAKIKVEN